MSTHKIYFHGEISLFFWRSLLFRTTGQLNRLCEQWRGSSLAPHWASIHSTKSSDPIGEQSKSWSDLAAVHLCRLSWAFTVDIWSLPDRYWLTAYVTRLDKSPYMSVQSDQEQHYSQRHVCTWCSYYSPLSLSRTRLSRITAYLEVKIWSLL